jgi:cytosine/adenosine deaminase-related metal-dependent hydrolase
MTSTSAKIRYDGMKSLLADAYVLTMDDAGTEHADGWILLEDGLIAAVGAGQEPEADERS